jgi:ubiquinone/menaquinone biosynthesis C-methylase UbiE
LSKRAQKKGTVEFLDKKNVGRALVTLFNDFKNRFAGPNPQDYRDAVKVLRSYYDGVEKLFALRLQDENITDQERTQLQQRLDVLKGHLKEITGKDDEQLAALIREIPDMDESRLKSGELEIPQGVAGLIMAMVHSQILDAEACLGQDMETLKALFSPSPALHRIGLYDTGMYWTMFSIVPIYPGKPLGRIPLIPRPFFSSKMSVQDKVLPVMGVRFLLGMSPLASCLGGFSRSLFSMPSNAFWILVEDTAFGIGRTRPILDPATPGAAILTSSLSRLTKENEEHDTSAIWAFTQTMYEQGIKTSQQDMSLNPIDGEYLREGDFIGSYDANTGTWDTDGIFNYILASKSVQRHDDEREMSGSRGAGFMDYYFGGFSWAQLWGSPVSVFMPGTGRSYREGRRFDELEKILPFKLAELCIRLERGDVTGGLYPVDPRLASCFAKSFSGEVFVAAIMQIAHEKKVNIGDFVDRLNISPAERQKIKEIASRINNGEVAIDQAKVKEVRGWIKDYCYVSHADEFWAKHVQPFTQDEVEAQQAHRYWRELNVVYTAFNVPIIVTSPALRETTSSLKDKEEGLKQKVRAAEEAGQKPQFTPEEKARIAITKKPLWARFVDGIRSIKWLNMTPWRGLDLVIRGIVTAVAGLILCWLILPLPVLVAFVALAITIKSFDVHRAVMSLLPSPTFKPWRTLSGIFFRGLRITAGIILGVLIAGSVIGLGLLVVYVLPWPVLFASLFKVAIPWLTSHLLLYIAGSSVIWPILRLIEKRIAKRFESWQFENSAFYKWYANKKRSNFARNMGFILSRIVLMAAYGYFTLRVAVRFGFRIIKLVPLLLKWIWEGWFRGPIKSIWKRVRGLRGPPAAGVTLKAPNDDAISEAETKFIDGLLSNLDKGGKLIDGVTHPDALAIIERELGRAIPSESVRIRVADLGDQLGIPRQEGATDPKNLIYAYGKREGNQVVITVTKAFYNKYFTQNSHLCAELINHEYMENIEGRFHAEAVRHAWMFGNNKFGISEFHKLYIDLLAAQADPEILRSFFASLAPTHANDPYGKFYGYARLKTNALEHSLLYRSNAGSLNLAPPLAEGTRNLEIGCGTGDSTVLLAGTMQGNSTLTAIDVDGAAVEQARARLSGIQGVTFEQRDVIQLEGQFDNAYALNTIHMAGSLENQTRFVQRVSASLNPNGTFTFNVPLRLSMDTFIQRDKNARRFYMDLVLKAQQIAGTSAVSEEKGHYNVMPAEEYKRILTEAGLEIEQGGREQDIQSYSTTLGELASMARMYPESILPGVPAKIAREAVEKACAELFDPQTGKFKQETIVQKQWMTFVARKPSLGVAEPMTGHMEERLRASRASDVLRELSLAETSNMLAPSLSMRPDRVISSEKPVKTSLVIGIPNQDYTPGVLEVVRQRLVDMGRTDVLVIPVDREAMQAKLEMLNVPYGVILDVDDINNVDKLLEPFMKELDLQGLVADYRDCFVGPSGLLAMTDRRGKASRAMLIKIINDRRLISRIISLNLEYIFTHEVNGVRCTVNGKRNTSPNTKHRIPNTYRVEVAYLRRDDD